MKQLAKQIEQALSESSSINHQVASLEEQVQDISESLKTAKETVEHLHRDARDLIGTTNWVVDGIRGLTETFELRAPITNKEEILAESERLLGKLQNNSLDAYLTKVQDDAAAAELSFAELEKWKKKIKEQEDKVLELRQELMDFVNMSSAFETELKGIKKTSAEANRYINKLPFFQLKALINGIEKDKATVEELLKEQKEKSTELSDLRNQLQDLNLMIKADLSNLEKLIEQAKTLLPGTTRRRRDVDQQSKQRILQELRAIEEKGKRLMGIYSAAQLESTAVIGATHIYEDLLADLSNARNLTTQALNLAHETGNDVQGVSEKTRAFYDSSSHLVANITTIKTDDLSEIENLKNKIEARLNELNATLSSIISTVSNAQESIDKNKEFEVITNQVESADETMSEVDKVNEEL